MNNKDIHQKIEKTVKWLQEKVETSNTKGLLVGLSGGIDSSVVACLIKKAFPDNSLAVILPIKSSEEDVKHGKKLIEKIGIQSLEIDLTVPHELILNTTMEKLIENNFFQEKNKRITDANLRARLRMSTLYTVANNLGYLVVGTDNAAEVLTGYFTKYGDGGVDILPLFHLLKREVYQWAKELEIPEEIINKAPSAGLWEGQTDEAEMGTSYQYIDDYILGLPVPEKDKEIIQRLNKISEHKRNMPTHPPVF